MQKKRKYAIIIIVEKVVKGGKGDFRRGAKATAKRCIDVRILKSKVKFFVAKGRRSLWIFLQKD